MLSLTAGNSSSNISDEYCTRYTPTWPGFNCCDRQIELAGLKIKLSAIPVALHHFFQVLPAGLFSNLFTTNARFGG